MKNLLTESIASLPSIVEDTIHTVFKSYKRVLRVNATDNTFVSIITQDDQYPETLYDWCKLSVDTGEIYYQDAEAFLKFMNPINLRSYFKSSEDKKRIFRYRRLALDGTYRWVALELFPSVEFTKDNQIMILYVRDIHDDYTYQISEQRKLYYLSTHDASTGLKNRLAFIDDTMYLEGYTGVVTIRVADSVSNIVDIVTQSNITDNNSIYFMTNVDLILLISEKESDRFVTNFWSLKNHLPSDTRIGYYYNLESKLNINEALFESEEMMYER